MEEQRENTRLQGGGGEGGEGGEGENLFRQVISGGCGVTWEEEQTNEGEVGRWGISALPLLFIYHAAGSGSVYSFGLLIFFSRVFFFSFST